MSATEPEDTDQLPLPLDRDDVQPAAVISIGSARRAGRPVVTAQRGLEPARTSFTEAELAHRRAMLEHLTKQSA